MPYYQPHVGTFALLDQISTILGSTKTSFWPFLNGTGNATYPYRAGTDGVYSPLTIDASTIELVMDPYKHQGGVFSYMNDSATANLLGGAASVYSHGNGTADTAFSAGMWILMQEAVGDGTRSLIAKYGSTATLREFDFRFDTNGNLILELYDESADGTEIATSAGTALTAWKWECVTATYDGGETAPVVNLYLNGTSVHDGTTVEAGATGYTAMEDTAAAVMVGARDAAGTAAQVFQGRFALPFYAGKELTAAEVTTIYNIGRILLGI